MISTFRSRTSRGRCCAPIRRRAPQSFGASAFLLILTIAAFFVTCGLLFADDDPPLHLGDADYILESGYPNPTRLPGPFTGAYDANQLLGATRFYDAGYTGTRSLMANIEAGYIWNGHETMTHVGLIPTSGSALGEFDRHATAVGMLMGGRIGGTDPGNYQRGIAPDAQLYSGAIATSWTGTRFTSSFFFDRFGISTYGPYRAAFTTGISTPGGIRTADVINSSWADNIASGTTGNDQLASTLDALANANPHTLFVVAAGNSGAGPNQVASPASGYNNLTVGALQSNGGLYNMPSAFTSGGPNNYQDPNLFVNNARQVVDIAAPGENVSSAYYGGQTGGNGPSLPGSPDGPAGGPNYYTHTIAGTSFAAPAVAGGVALLYDASYANFPANPNARDARVMKAVIMNAADKTIGWNNGQTPNPNGFGGVVTTQGLDNRVGTGRMNLNRAYDQLLSGTADVAGTLAGPMGLVNSTGWDYGQVGQGVTNDYEINSPLQAGTSFTATLDWYRDRQPVGTTSFSDNSFDNLDLELWSDVAGIPINQISVSNSRYNDTEHFSFLIPTTGQYMLRVRWTEELFDVVPGGDLNIEQYGVAWTTATVPEPATIVMAAALFGGCLLVSRRRTHQASRILPATIPRSVS
jgi:hypothetical protein